MTRKDTMVDGNGENEDHLQRQKNTNAHLSELADWA